MAEIGGDNSKVNIPELADDANIQDAFRLYHTGSEDGIYNASNKSMMKIINDIYTYINLQVGQEQLQLTPLTPGSGGTNINNLTIPGVYYMTGTPSNGLGYPVLQPGILLFFDGTTGEGVSEKTIATQIYQTYESADVGYTSSIYFRSRLIANQSGTWSTWSSIEDYAKSIYSNFDTNVKPYESLIRYLNGITADITTLIPDNEDLDARYYLRSDASPTTSFSKKTVRLFVQSEIPTDPQTNDLWFW